MGRPAPAARVRDRRPSPSADCAFLWTMRAGRRLGAERRRPKTKRTARLTTLPRRSTMGPVEHARSSVRGSNTAVRWKRAESGREWDVLVRCASVRGRCEQEVDASADREPTVRLLGTRCAARKESAARLALPPDEPSPPRAADVTRAGAGRQETADRSGPRSFCVGLVIAMRPDGRSGAFAPQPSVASPPLAARVR